MCEEDGKKGGPGKVNSSSACRCGAYLNRDTVPIVQVERAHLGDMHSEATMNSRACDAQCYAQVDACPLHICVFEHKLVCDA